MQGIAGGLAAWRRSTAICFAEQADAGRRLVSDAGGQGA
jgi:hypothetical protein